jgi:hypothetical protein
MRNHYERCRQITDILIQDIMPLNANPYYDLEDGYQYLYLDGEEVKESLSSGGQVKCPMMKTDRPFTRHSYVQVYPLNEPPNVKLAVEKMMLKAAEVCTNKFEIVLEDLPAVIEKNLLNISGTAGWQAFICSPMFLDAHKLQLADMGFYIFCVAVEGMADNKIIVCPDPEWVGALSLTYDESEFGAFMLPQRLMVVEIK